MCFILLWDREQILHRFNLPTDEPKKKKNSTTKTLQIKPRVLNHDLMVFIPNDSHQEDQVQPEDLFDFFQKWA